MSRVRNLVGYSAALTARSAMAVAKIFGVSDMVWSGISRIGIRGGGVQAASGVMVTAESAMLVAAYKRGVELLAGHVAKTNFCVKRGSEHDKQHPAYKLLRRWARHHQVSAFEFRRTMMAQVLTRGNAYAYIVRRNMEPVELLILDAGQIQPYLIQGELLYKVNGREKMLASSDVIHIKGLGFNGFEGLDPIRYYAKEVLGLAIATQNYAAKYYENGGTPQAYLKTDVPLTDELFNRLKGEAGPLKRSLENPHELPILEASDIKAVGLSAEQTQLLSARKDIILDIANLLGLPPHKLGLAISSSYGSLEEENDAFREDALEPWLCQFESEFAKLLTEDEQEQETHDIEAERDDIKRLKLVDAADYLSKLTGSQPLATVNEARAKIGLPPVEGGDDLSKPLNMGNQGGDPSAQPNAASPEDDSEDDGSEEEPEEDLADAMRSALRYFEARCGAGAPGQKGFMSGNTCAAGGKKTKGGKVKAAAQAEEMTADWGADGELSGDNAPAAAAKPEPPKPKASKDIEFKIDRKLSTPTRAEKAWAHEQKKDFAKRKAVASWSSEGYKSIREETAKGTPSENTKKFLEVIDSAPKFQGEVYRGMKVTKESAPKLQALLNAGVGATFKDDAPFSTSRNPKVANDFAGGGVVMKLKVKSGARIEHVNGNYRGEMEVVSRPGTSYKVTSIVKGPSINGKPAQVLIEVEEV